MTWDGNRYNERFTYRRVKWPSLEEAEEYGFITKGNVELSAFSTVKATCSFDFDGEVPDTVDAVRIIYGFDDDRGNHHEQVLGTFICQYGDVSYRAENGGIIATGTADGASVLSIAANRVIGYPLTVPAGTNAVDKARNMLALGPERDGLGLSVVRDASAYTLSSSHTFSPDMTYLEAVNWLLAAAGFSSADVTPSGMIALRRYVEPTSRATAYTFANDGHSIMMAGVNEESDYMTSPNVVRMSYEDDNVSVSAVAKAVSGSRNSLNARGNREITLYEEVTELGDGDKLELLKAMALKKLLDNGSDILKLSWSHAYVPIMCGDAVTVDYGGRRWDLSVTNIGISLEPSCPTETKGRAFINSSIVTSVEGEAYELRPAGAAVMDEE